ncbi:MAG: FAD-binding oxidoreductase [Pseudomonadota bacterium]
MSEKQVVIVGGAVIGSAVAYFLTADPAFRGRVTVVEKDPSYAACATGRSAGGIRQQFSNPENVAMSLFGIQFLRQAETLLAVEGTGPALSLREEGYLFLATEKGLGVLKDNLAVQIEGGADIAFFEPAALKARFPWLTVDDLAGGSLGLSGEGWLDPYALLQGFRRKARAQGAVYVTGEVTDLEMSGGQVAAARLADGQRLACDALVNAAGAFGGRLAELAGVSLPVTPRKRLVFVVDCQKPLPGCPLLIDPSGVYIRPEGAHFICGKAPDETDDPESQDFEIDYGFFEEQIWPVLAARIPALEAIKVVNAWAGHYDVNSFDHNVLLGPDPACPNFYCANGFSGHGLQQSPAVGRALAELIVQGTFQSLDLSRFSPARVAAGRPVVERNVV